MPILYLVLALYAGGAVTSLLLGRRKNALAVASFFAVSASVIGFCFAVFLLAGGEQFAGTLPLPLPMGACSLSLDPLAAVFLLPVFFLSAAGGFLLPARISALEGKAFEGSVHYGRHGFFFCLLALSMVLVLSAADAVFFLIAWEMMSLAPFFLISPQDRDSKERNAVWIYLLAAHLGALPLLLLFAGMTVEAGGTGFAALHEFAGDALSGGWSNAGFFFALGLAGFGVKAGLVPLHMWMPEAHASAPGHVAVLLSGTMLNLGIYGIMRLLTLLGPPEFWWACALVAVGAFSGLLGILLAIAQSDIKRTLAYSSAENMGLVVLALGAGMLACLNDISVAAALLLGGAVLHMWNHSLFKSLLFLGANAIKESIHVTTIQHLGGLQKRMPVTGGCFAVGCAAIAGIPPLNGFMSELVIYMGFVFGSEGLRGTWTSLLFWLAFVLLAAIAGMALFAFTRMYGLAFLGAPRSSEARVAGEPEHGLRGVMSGFAVLCLGASLAGPILFNALSSLIVWFAGEVNPHMSMQVADVATGRHSLAWYSLAGVFLAVVSGGVWLWVRKRVRENGEQSGPTWDCGYRYPTARMQYSGGSFAHSLVLMLRPLIRSRIETPEIRGLFPKEPRAVMSTPDWPAKAWEKLLFSPVAFLSDRAKDLQLGLVNIYILYILVALIAALVWALGWT